MSYAHRNSRRRRDSLVIAENLEPRIVLSTSGGLDGVDLDNSPPQKIAGGGGSIQVGGIESTGEESCNLCFNLGMGYVAGLMAEWSVGYGDNGPYDDSSGESGNGGHGGEIDMP